MRRASIVARLVEEYSPPIPEPMPMLEQYTTPGDIAARLASNMSLREDLEEASILDLGAGTCRLSLALALYGATRIVAVDVDYRLPPLCIGAFRNAGLPVLDAYIVGRIRPGTRLLVEASFDIIVMNPPFGVQRKGADTEFLVYAMSLRPRRIYAILKTGNEQYHTGLAKKYGYRHRVLYRERFPIPATMRHHKSRIRRVDVNVSVFERI